jgi:LemA protein
MKTYIIVGIIVLIVLIIVGKIIGWMNSFKRAMIKIDESASDIDVALTKRYDVLTKMIEVVKGYVKHEKEVMFTVVNYRKDMPIKEKEKANEQMNENYSRIVALAENYPDLKASDNFIVLQKAIVDVEEHLQAARRFYNSNITSYNELIETFPTNVIAKNKGYTRKDYFKAEDEAKTKIEISA